MPSNKRSLACVAVLAAAFLSGCRSSHNAFNIPGNRAKWETAKADARLELANIPPPAKGRLPAGADESEWRNPFLTVGSGMIQLRIYLADENASQLDRGGLTRLDAARKQVLELRLRDLPRALSSLPESAWPYGRVVAMDEALEPPSQKSTLNAHFSTTAKILHDLAIETVESTTTGSGR